MSFQLKSYPGTGKSNEQFHYSQAVKVGNIIRTSGQGGWDDNNGGKIDEENPLDQVPIAFKNAMRALQEIDPNVTWKVWSQTNAKSGCEEEVEKD